MIKPIWLLYHKNMPRQTVLRPKWGFFGIFVQLPYFGVHKKAIFGDFAVTKHDFFSFSL